MNWFKYNYYIVLPFGLLALGMFLFYVIRIALVENKSGDPGDIAGASGESLQLQGSMIFAIAFDPDGNRFAVGLEEANVFLFDSATRKRLATLGGGRSEARIVCLHFSPDGSCLAAGTDDGYVYVWSRDGAILFEGQVYSGFLVNPPVEHLSFVNNDELILYTFREVAKLYVSKKIFKKRSLPVYIEYGASFHGHSMLADHEGHAYMFDEEGALKKKIKLRTGPVTFFTPFKRTCLIGSWVGELVVFEPGKDKASIPWPRVGEGRQITDCEVLDKERLAMVFANKYLQIYDTEDGLKKVGPEIELPKIYRSMAHRPNTNLLYLGLYERLILIHDVDKGHIFPFIEKE